MISMFNKLENKIRLLFGIFLIRKYFDVIKQNISIVKERIEELLLQKKLFDFEYPGLPKVSSRVQIKDGRCGTVEKSKYSKY